MSVTFAPKRGLWLPAGTIVVLTLARLSCIGDRRPRPDPITHTAGAASCWGWRKPAERHNRLLALPAATPTSST